MNLAKVGMYGGKFLPFHVGHLSCIIKASCQVEELYVVLSHHELTERRYFAGLNMKPIPYKERYKWLCQATKDMPNVKIIEVEETWNKEKGVGLKYSWEQGAEDIKKKIGKPIDMVFFGDDYDYDHWKKLYPETKHFCKIPRDIIDISATKIRHEGPFKHWDYIPQVVRPYFIKKICVVGTESCGKSTLVNNLANYYNTNQVKEYGRDVCEEVGGAENMVPMDFKKILCGQVMLEEEAIKHSNKLLFIDSEQMVTKYYLGLYINDYEDVFNMESLATNISNAQHYDLILLMAPTVPWVDDGTRLHGDEDIRMQNHKRLKTLYDRYNINYIEITEDDYFYRFDECVKIINKTFMEV